MIIKSDQYYTIGLIRPVFARLNVKRAHRLHITRRNAQRSLRSLGLRHIFTSAALR